MLLTKIMLQDLRPPWLEDTFSQSGIPGLDSALSKLTRPAVFMWKANVTRFVFGHELHYAFSEAPGGSCSEFKGIVAYPLHVCTEQWAGDRKSLCLRPASLKRCLEDVADRPRQMCELCLRRSQQSGVRTRARPPLRVLSIYPLVRDRNGDLCPPKPGWDEVVVLHAPPKTWGWNESGATSAQMFQATPRKDREDKTNGFCNIWWFTEKDSDQVWQRSQSYYSKHHS